MAEMVRGMARKAWRWSVLGYVALFAFMGVVAAAALYALIEFGGPYYHP